MACHCNSVLIARFLIAGLLVSNNFILFGQSVAPAVSLHRKVHVVIVAVPEYSIKEYNTPVVRDSIVERCEDVRKYFDERLHENVQIDQYCTKESTTREALRALFEITVPSFSAGTVTLLFIMSHGEQLLYDSQIHGSDVELITSDTVMNDDADTDHKRQLSSILVGSEMLSWLQAMPNKSTLLTFLDFCHSGAMGSLSTYLGGLIQQGFGQRALVMTSSLPGDGTYRALFTKDLLSSWDTSDNKCLDADSIGDSIYEKMKTQAPLAGTEGIPQVAIRYQGPLCLGNFGGDHKLLFMYAGQDAEGRPYHYQVFEEGQANANPIIDSQIRSVYVPVLLNAGKYTVKLERNDVSFKPIFIDLSTSSSQFIWLDEHALPVDVAKFSETMATIQEENGQDKSAVNATRVAASSAYRIAGFEGDATRVVALVPSNAKFEPATVKVHLDFSPQGILLHAPGNESYHLANGMSEAAAFLSSTVAFMGPGEPRSDAASLAYNAKLATGDQKGATRLRMAYGTPQSAILQNASFFDDAVSKENLTAWGLATILGAQTPSVANPELPERKRLATRRARR